jgi:hypothetical protein
VANDETVSDQLLPEIKTCIPRQHSRPGGIGPKSRLSLDLASRIRIQRGPLSGMEGVLQEVKYGGRLVVKIVWLGSATKLELDASWVDIITG